jgi:hypothetical protein
MSASFDLAQLLRPIQNSRAIGVAILVACGSGSAYAQQGPAQSDSSPALQ